MIRFLAALLLMTSFAAAEPATTPVQVAQTRAAPILVESVAFDHRDRLLVSSVHETGIFRLRKNGELRRWSAPGATQGVFGILADGLRRELWAASSGSAHGGDPAARPALLRFDLRNGRLKQNITAPVGAKSFGDLALGPDGTVFVSDSGAGDVLRLRPGAEELETVVSLGARGSPQGLAVSPDGRVLVFAGYGSGLHRVDLRTGAHARIEAPQSMELRGVDGIVRMGQDLLMVQNGISPPRVLRVALNDDWSAIERLDVLVRDGGMQEPTGGVVRGDNFVFVSRSQWTDFNADGKPKSLTPLPAVISQLPLGPVLDP
jgi:hypothetical protein